MRVLRQTARLPASIARMENAISQIALRLAQYRKPIITGLAGRVAGDDLGIFMSSDFRVAADDCTFLFPNVRLGLPPSGPLAYFLERHVGRGRATEILLSGRSLDAQEAHRLGLVTEVTPVREVPRRCSELAQRLLELPPAAVSATRRLLLPTAEEFADYLRRSVKIVDAAANQPAGARDRSRHSKP